MKLVQVDHIPRRLNFGSNQQWPKELPSICWREILLTEAEHGDLCIDQGHESLINLFTGIYPDLTLPELARIYRFWTHNLDFKDLEWQNFWADLCIKHNLRDGESLRETLLRILETPIEFQNWLTLRKSTAKDVQILRELESIEGIIPGLHCIVEKKCTKSQGSQALEWLSELILLDRLDQNLFETPEDQNAELWLKAIKRSRYPNSSQEDSNMKGKVRSLPWPQFASVDWVRKGDQSAVDIHFHFTDLRDLENKIRGLASCTENLKNHGDLPWT